MKITIACAQIQVEPGNPEANTKKALAYLEKARAQQADIVLFPELTIPGYLLGDLWEQNAFLRDCEAWGKELIAALLIALLVVTFVPGIATLLPAMMK